MIIDDFDWDKLYEKADVFMRNSNVRTFNVTEDTLFLETEKFKRRCS